MFQLLSFSTFFMGLIMFFIFINDLSIMTLMAVTFIIGGLIALSRSA
jgi:hypothetical protein